MEYGKSYWNFTFYCTNVWKKSLPQNKLIISEIKSDLQVHSNMIFPKKTFNSVAHIFLFSNAYKLKLIHEIIFQ